MSTIDELARTYVRAKPQNEAVATLMSRGYSDTDAREAVALAVGQLEAGVAPNDDTAKRKLRKTEAETGRTAAETNEGAEDGDEALTDRETASKLATGPELWHSAQDGAAFASLPVGGHIEHVPVRSARFKDWLILEFVKVKGKAPSTDAISVASQYAEAVARTGAEHAVHLRIAHTGAAVYVDLCDDHWRVIEITKNGWNIVDRSPVKFQRTPDMRALPVPTRDGSLGNLRPFLNAQDDEHWMLMIAWLLGTLSDGPYPLLALSGAGGVAKTYTAKRLRSVIDPAETPTRRGKLRSADDLAITAKWNAVLIFDNLSGLSAEMSDALCTLATGDGFGKRSLYTDDAEKLFYAKRPAILTGIEEVVTRGDLNSRTMMLNLPPLTDRRPERELDAEWDERHPGVLGALLDAAVVALKRRDDVAAPTDIRMADFAQWTMAALPALEWTEDHFLAVFRENRDEARQHEVEASPFCSAVLAWLQSDHVKGIEWQEVDQTRVWEGTATKLLSILNAYAKAEELPTGDMWPKVAHKVTGRLNAHAEALKASGLSFSRRSSNGSKLLSLTYARPETGSLQGR